MINTILCIIICVAVVALAVYATQTKQKINSMNNAAVMSVEGTIKKFAYLNRLLICLWVLIVLFVGGLCFNTATLNEKANTPIEIHDTIVNPTCLNRLEALDKEQILISAICEVESGDNEKCPGGGAMQITRVCVDAANKFQNKVHYEYADVYSREKSYEIWHIIQRNCNKSGDIERAIRLWNGGPGYTMAGTDNYYKKVMKAYNRKIDEHLNDICKQYKSLSIK